MQYRPLNINDAEREFLIDVLLDTKDRTTLDYPTVNAGRRLCLHLLKKLNYKPIK